MKQKKKNQKLLIQISLVLIPVFIVLIIAVSFIMYNSTVNGFLEAQNSNMETMLTKSFYDITGNTFFYEDVMEWVIEQWEKDPALPVSDITQEELGKYIDFSEEYQGIIGTMDFVNSMTPDLQAYFVKTKFRQMWEAIMLEATNNRYEDLFLIDVDGDNFGMVLCEFNLNDDSKNLGDRYDIDLSQHPAIEKLMKNSSGDIEFEKVEDFPMKGSCYIACKSLILSGRTKAVMGIVYNWDSLKETMNSSLMKALIMGIGGIVLVMLLLLIMLYRRSIRPLARIQHSVRSYTEDKDSAAVISKMSQIKERNEFGLLSDDISGLASAIDQYTREITELTGERERVAAELDMARAIQAGQLPRVFPAFPDRKELDIYAGMTPAKEVGGDFYDFFFVDEDHLALVIADVSGKGVPAALFMMSSKMLISSFTSMGLGPAEVLRLANEKLCQNNEEDMFVTVWLGVLELSTGKITAANAGHLNPAIRQPGGSFELFEDMHTLFVGAFEDAVFEQYEFTLEKGGTLFVYTDGVSEATDSSNKLYGTDRMIEALNQAPDASPKELLENVHRDVDAFVGEATQYDDLTMLGIKLL